MAYTNSLYLSPHKYTDVHKFFTNLSYVYIPMYMCAYVQTCIYVCRYDINVCAYIHIHSCISLNVCGLCSELEPKTNLNYLFKINF